MQNLFNPQPNTINWSNLSGECVSVIHRALGAAIQERLYIALMDFPAVPENDYLNIPGAGTGDTFEDPLEDHPTWPSWNSLRQKLDHFIKPNWFTDLDGSTDDWQVISRWNEADLLADCGLTEWPELVYTDYREQSKEKYQAIYQILKRLTLTLAQGECKIELNGHFGKIDGSDYFHVSGDNPANRAPWDPDGINEFNSRVTDASYNKSNFDRVLMGDFRQLYEYQGFIHLICQRANIVLEGIPAGIPLSISAATIIKTAISPSQAPLQHPWESSAITVAAENAQGDFEDLRITVNEVEAVTIADMTLQDISSTAEKIFYSYAYVVIDWQPALLHKEV